MKPLKQSLRPFAWILGLTLGITGLGGPSGRSQAAEDPGVAEGDVAPQTARPQAHLILGVPFVAWGEAAAWNYRSKDVLNPSWPAAEGMVLGYWGQDPRRVAALALESQTNILEFRKGWVVEDAKGPGSLEKLKTFLARGIPVIVIPALTPLGHPLSVTAEVDLATGRIKAPGVEPTGPYSSALGKFATLEGHRVVRDSMNYNPIREAVNLAAQVAVGYDDQRRVVMLHNPTFGPAWEISYEDLERAWAANDYAWSVSYPKSFSGKASARADRPPYRPRTPDELAVEHFIYGYALSSSGNLVGGEKRFRQGLATSGISQGHRFLLLFELALTLGEEKRFDEAVAAAEEATRVLSDHAAPWAFLAQAYLISTIPDAEKKAKEAREKAEKLKRDHRAHQVVVAAVPCNFWVENLARIRGWCRR